MLKENGRYLIESGYSICAIAPGQKRPMGDGWNEHPLTIENCETETARGMDLKGCGIGIICGTENNPVCGLDFDVSDAQLAYDLRIKVESIINDDVFCPPAYRQGEPPKFLIPVRLKTKNVRYKLFKEGAQAGLDILSGDGASQFVALGRHPKGFDYTWHQCLKADTGPIPAYDELPEITEAQLEEIKGAFFEMMAGAGYSEGAASAVAAQTSDAVLDRLLTPERPRLSLTLEQAEKYIQAVDGSSRDPWLWVGMALNHQFGGTKLADDALLLWDKWSQTQPKYAGFEDVKKQWDSFDPKRKGGRTMRWVVAEWRRKRNPDAAAMTEMGRAYRFVEEYGDKFRFDLDAKKWYLWGGVHWRQIAIDELGQYVADILGPILLEDIAAAHPSDEEKKPMLAFYNRCQTIRAQTALSVQLSRMAAFHCHTCDFDKDPRFFGVANGDVNLETGALEAPDPKRMITRWSNARYDENAKAPLWEKAISDIFFDDTEMVEYMQRLFGYAMQGTACEQRFFVLYGDGANGKSTMIDTIAYVFGQYAGNLSPEAVTSKGRAPDSSASGPKPEIAALRGRRFVYIEETEADAKLREANVKKLSSQGFVEGRALYSNSLSIPVTWAPFMATNYVPRVRGSDGGIWRRFVKIAFNRNFETDDKVPRDRDLDRKLKAELDGIFMWCLRGAMAYRRMGLLTPKKVEDDVREYQKSQDLFREFLDDECDLTDKEAKISIQSFFNAWKRWYDGGFADRDYGTKQTISEKLKRWGVSKAKARINGSQCWCYVGVKLKDADTAEDLF